MIMFKRYGKSPAGLLFAHTLQVKLVVDAMVTIVQSPDKATIFKQLFKCQHVCMPHAFLSKSKARAVNVVLQVRAM